MDGQERHRLQYARADKGYLRPAEGRGEQSGKNQPRSGFQAASRGNASAQDERKYADAAVAFQRVSLFERVEIFFAHVFFPSGEYALFHPVY